MKLRVIAVGVASTLFVCGAASAQENTTTAPPAVPAPPSPSTEEVASAPVTVTSAEAPTEPAHEPATSEKVETKTKLSCRFLSGSCAAPHLALALEGGGVSFNEGGPFATGSGTGSVSSIGPSWGLRVGVELFSWLAVDAHYIGMNNHASGEATPNGSVSLFTNALVGEVRLTLPTPYVQPYLFTGAGYYNTSITGSDAAKAASPLVGSHELGIPVGVGFGIPVGAFSVGGELAYHRLFGEAFTADDNEIGGGDLTTLNAVVRARF